MKQCPLIQLLLNELTFFYLQPRNYLLVILYMGSEALNEPVSSTCILDRVYWTVLHCILLLPNVGYGLIVIYL